MFYNVIYEKRKYADNIKINIVEKSNILLKRVEFKNNRFNISTVIIIHKHLTETGFIGKMFFRVIDFYVYVS